MKNRENIYYWKCDRPSAFFSLQKNGTEADDLLEPVRKLVGQKFYDSDFDLRPIKAEGNHQIYVASENGSKLLIRAENGPEKDNYMLVEGKIIDEIRKLGIPAPEIYLTDTSRKEYDFAYQVMEMLNYPDLNKLYKGSRLNLMDSCREIGRSIALWQSIRPPGFGPFNLMVLEQTGRLEGLYSHYEEYYFLNLDKHLEFLVAKGFISAEEVLEIHRVINQHREFLKVTEGCLVHKDLALWNILGDDGVIKGFIDWDDAIVGDPTDDLSLLACFYSDEVVDAAIDGYKMVRPLPEGFSCRFYLHLLRNMIVKSVIRVGANYFGKTDDFFLIEKGKEGLSLEQTTRCKLFLAVERLKEITCKTMI